MDTMPKWTLIYNSREFAPKWIGLAWEFFDEELDARYRYDVLVRHNQSPTLRPYDSTTDRVKLGGVHIMHGEG